MERNQYYFPRSQKVAIRKSFLVGLWVFLIISSPLLLPVMVVGPIVIILTVRQFILAKYPPKICYKYEYTHSVLFTPKFIEIEINNKKVTVLSKYIKSIAVFKNIIFDVKDGGAPELNEFIYKFTFIDNREIIREIFFKDILNHRVVGDFWGCLPQEKIDQYDRSEELEQYLGINANSIQV